MSSKNEILLQYWEKKIRNKTKQLFCEKSLMLHDCLIIDMAFPWMIAKNIQAVPQGLVLQVAIIHPMSRIKHKVPKLY